MSSESLLDDIYSVYAQKTVCHLQGERGMSPEKF